MTRLTRAKHLTRMSAVGLGIFVVVLIVGRISFSVLDAFTVDRRSAEQLLRPDVALGPIPTPVLTKANIQVSASSIRLDLVDGQFPQATTSATLYKVGQPALSLSAQDRARARATKLGFTTNPSQPDPNTFQWVEGGRTLTINLEDQNFVMTTDPSRYNMSNRLSFSRFEPLATQSSQFIKSQFTFLDLNNNSPQYKFVLPAGSNFQPQSPDAVTPSNYVQATVLRQPINDLPIYSALGKFGPITLEAIPALKTTRPSNTFNLDQVIRLRSDYQTIDHTAKGTYPVISSQAAYELLKADFSDYLVSVLPHGNTNPTTLSSINVQFITLVYLEPDSKNRTFIQPAWMFEGRGSTNAGPANWVAYVPAVNFTKTQELLNPKK